MPENTHPSSKEPPSETMEHILLPDCVIEHYKKVAKEQGLPHYHMAIRLALASSVTRAYAREN